MPADAWKCRRELLSTYQMAKNTYSKILLQKCPRPRPWACKKYTAYILEFQKEKKDVTIVEMTHPVMMNG